MIKNKYNFVVPVWGTSHIDFFCKFGLASLLSEPNVAYLKDPNFTVTICTRTIDRQKFYEHEPFLKLCGLANVEFELVDDMFILDNQHLILQMLSAGNVEVG